MITTKTRKCNEPSLSLIVGLALAAAAVPLYATYVQYRTVTIEAAAEDDCPYIYGAYDLKEVTPFTTSDGMHKVYCVYQ
jgi:hypothetical protein